MPKKEKELTDLKDTPLEEDDEIEATDDENAEQDDEKAEVDEDRE